MARELRSSLFRNSDSSRSVRTFRQMNLRSRFGSGVDYPFPVLLMTPLLLPDVFINVSPLWLGFLFRLLNAICGGHRSSPSRNGSPTTDVRSMGLPTAIRL